MALINCPECGGQISDKATACVHCGYVLVKEQKILCPECGAEIDANASICGNCGCPIQEPAPQSGGSCGTQTATAGQAWGPATGSVSADYGRADLSLESAEPSYTEILQQLSIKKEKAKKKKIIIIAVIAAVVIAVVGIIVGVAASKKSSSHSSSSSSSYSSSSYSGSSSYELSHSAYCMLYMDLSNITVTHSRNYTYVKGTITNTGDYRIKYVKVKAACKNSSGTVIDTDWTYAVDSTWLEPGESNQFEMMIKDESNKIKKADVTIIYE